jgi:inhibitor of cysteine peptidase
MATITLSENDNQQHIEIDVDDTIQLQLDESPTTGYRWEITELNKNDVEIISDDFKTNVDKAIGGSGKKMIALKVLRKATGSIKLENRRSWQANADKSFEIFYR